jgi:RNA polymerase sigma factor (sigma-70 family)
VSAAESEPVDPSDAAAVPALLAAAASGDERAWDALVDRFGSMIWAVARAHRLGDADAADVAQATWTALLSNLGRINDPERIGAWLATTARRESLRALRHAKANVPYGDELPEPEIHEVDPSARLSDGERDAALWRCFMRLRDGDRALLRMLMADPAPSYEEISAALNIPIGSIGPTRARALERLRRELGRDGATALMRA